jgi:hypothetical protein
LTCQDLSQKRSSSSLNKSNWKRIKLLGYSFLGCGSKGWPVIVGDPEVIQMGIERISTGMSALLG